MLIDTCMVQVDLLKDFESATQRRDSILGILKDFSTKRESVVHADSVLLMLQHEQEGLGEQLKGYEVCPTCGQSMAEIIAEVLS